jgi:hypothetical protein
MEDKLYVDTGTRKKLWVNSVKKHAGIHGSKTYGAEVLLSTVYIINLDETNGQDSWWLQIFLFIEIDGLQTYKRHMRCIAECIALICTQGKSEFVL